MIQNPLEIGTLIHDYEERLRNRSWLQRMREQYVDPVIGFVQNIPYYIRHIKWAYQRVRYGISDRDVWGLHTYLASIACRGLETIKKYKCGVPGHFTESATFEEAEQKWDAVLGDMIFAFTVERSCGEDIEWIVIRDAAEREQQIQHMKKFAPYYHFMDDAEIARYDRGWDYFRTHYQSLWD